VRPENVPLSNASLPRGLRLPTWPVNASRSLPHCRPGAGGMGVGPPVAVGFEWPGFMQRSSEQAPAQHKYWYSGKCRIHIVIILCSWQRQRPPLRPPPRRPSQGRISDRACILSDSSIHLIRLFYSLACVICSQPVFFPAAPDSPRDTAAHVGRNASRSCWWLANQTRRVVNPRWRG
jgi:hypothetical protein